MKHLRLFTDVEAWKTVLMFTTVKMAFNILDKLLVIMAKQSFNNSCDDWTMMTENIVHEVHRDIHGVQLHFAQYSSYLLSAVKKTVQLYNCT